MWNYKDTICRSVSPYEQYRLSKDGSLLYGLLVWKDYTYKIGHTSFNTPCLLNHYKDLLLNNANSNWRKKKKVFNLSDHLHLNATLH